MDTDFLDWALADFSGYVAADELYDGPFCILSAVDNRCYKRILYDVLDHDPTHEDIRAVSAAFAHGLVDTPLDPRRGHDRWLGALSRAPRRGVRGRPASNLYVSYRGRGEQSRLRGRGQRPQGPRSPTTQTTPRAPEHARSQAGGPHEKAARNATRRVVHPSVSVRPTSPEQNRTQALWRITRGLPQLHALRAIMEQVYALFDRRCRTQTALDKLAKLRRRVQRFPSLGDTLKKLFAPTLEKALTFLDDTLLPSTSNAVERGNRRYRKMQKHVYRVRTQVQISARLALDMWREAQAEGRQQTLASLHQARAG